MAVTYDGLIEDIEKVIQKCDLDLEVEAKYLSEKSWTIPELKIELANWKERLKTKNEASREIKKIVSTARDFFVKMDKVFKADAYMIDVRYIIPGERSKEALIGETYLQIDDEFVDALRDVIFHGEKEGVWHIPSIPDLKAGLADAITNKTLYNSPYQKMDNSDNIRKELEELKAGTYKDLDSFVTIPKQDNPEIFTRKKLFSLEMEDVIPIFVSIQLLPTITSEESLEEVEYCLKKYDVDQSRIPVYYGRFRIWFSHFVIHLRYTYT